MYVKTYNPEGWHLSGPHRDLSYGTEVIHDGRTGLGDPPFIGPDSVIGEIFPLVSSVSVMVDPAPLGEMDGKPFWNVRWVRWSGERCIEGVVSTQPIYIVGANGKTIDTVR